MRTYTPEEIRAQIAQAEIDAYFRNDPDAALAASKQLGASFMLRGPDHRAGRLQSDDAGQPGLGEHGLHADGAATAASISDTRRELTASRTRAPTCRAMALTLVNEKADEVVAKLYARLLPERRTAAAEPKPQPK